MTFNYKKIAILFASILLVSGIITFSSDNPLRSVLTLKQFSVSDNDTSKQILVNPQGGTYAKYSDQLVKEANGNIVIFVGAKWCITCQNTDKAIVSNINSIPANLTILNLDFDENKSLLKKYEVLLQHTFVKIDNQGNLIKKDGNLGEFANGLDKLNLIAEFAK